MATGLVAAVALGLAVMISAAPDCKTSWGNAACLPLKSQAQTAQKSSIAPKPRPEPGGAKAAGSTKLAAQGQAKPKRAAAPGPATRHGRAGRSRSSGRMARARTARRGQAGNLGPAPDLWGRYDFQCADDCRYQAWFNRYAAWYYAYGRYDGAGGQERMEQGRIRRDTPQENFRPSPAPAQDDRARLDPWHGYDSRDGLENGY